jgi:hypothetical protein
MLVFLINNSTSVYLSCNGTHGIDMLSIVKIKDDIKITNEIVSMLKKKKKGIRSPCVSSATDLSGLLVRLFLGT